MAITDKMVKNGRLSVNPHHNDQKFTDKSLENAGLSVKYGLLTDKSAKNGTLSVNLNEIFDKSVEQHCIQKKPDKVSRKSTASVRHFINLRGHVLSCL